MFFLDGGDHTVINILCLYGHLMGGILLPLGPKGLICSSILFYYNLLSAGRILF